MNIREFAMQDIAFINSDANGFADSMVMTSPDATVTKTVYGRFARRFVPVTTENGGVVNARHTAITVSESILLAAGITTRNADGEIAMIGWLIVFKDSTASNKTFVVANQEIDETLGAITFILSEKEIEVP